MEAHRDKRYPDPMQPPLLPSNNVEAAVVVGYRECQRNHAASTGAYVYDGCGEFIANGEDGTPEGLKCAACECHRSFHRQEMEGESQYSTTWMPAATHNPPPLAAATTQPLYQQYHHKMVPTDHALGEDLGMFRTHPGGEPLKKRFRTKFTKEQKQKMHDFAEKLGWKLLNQDEQKILQFCNQAGVSKKVFKVWMHNSKQAYKKKQDQQDSIKLN